MSSIDKFDLVMPDWPAPDNVRAFTTTRKGGISRVPWNTLNLGGNCGDDRGSVQKNRILLRSLLPSRPRWLKQVHGTHVFDLDALEDGTLELENPGVLEADAVLSAHNDRICAVLTADCLPVVFCNKKGTKVAAAHAGWRGLANGVLENTVAGMRGGVKHRQTAPGGKAAKVVQPGDIMAWMGPAIGPDAFEVGRDVYDTYCQADEENVIAFKPHGDRWLADLYTLARLALARVGVVDVYGGEHCTYTNAERFFSYRRDGETGRMGTLIWLASAD